MQIPTRPTEIRRNRHLILEIGGDFVPHGSEVGFAGYSGNPDKHPRIAGPPHGRFCGEGAGIREIPTRPTEIRRHGHLRGATGRNVVPPGSVADCVESAENPDKPPLSADPPHRPAGSVANGRASGGSPPDQPRFGEMDTYAGRPGAISYLVDQWSIV